MLNKWPHEISCNQSNYGTIQVITM
jgi:hypothetical protein